MSTQKLSGLDLSNWADVQRLATFITTVQNEAVTAESLTVVNGNDDVVDLPLP